MKRDLDKIKREQFDLLIIGAGIHGAAIAFEASLAGLKVCLIDKYDFGSQTSANSLKVLHGGLRYLQHGNIKRMRESIYSRKVFQRIAPHLIQNIPFVIPTSGFTVKSRLALWLALKLNDIISFDRNKNILEECKIDKGQTISKDELAEIAPGIIKEKTSGGAVWYESIAKNTERLLFEFLHIAAENKTELANYLEAVEYNFDGNKISSVRVHDKIGDQYFNVKADVIVNSVGPWLNKILMETQDYNLLKTPLTKAVNIIIKGNPFGKYAVGIESFREFKDKSAIVNKGKRLFFFVPLNNYTMIGTTYKILRQDPDDCKISSEDINEILDEINSAHKGLNIKMDDVTQTHVGAQAMPDDSFENEFDVQPETHSQIFDHSKKGNIKNLISVKSVKYTTAPSIAKNIVSKVLGKRSRSDDFNSNDEFFSNHNKIRENVFLRNDKFDKTTLSRFWNSYGKRSLDVMESIEKDKRSSELLFEYEKIYKGEIFYLIEKEMAINSSDIIDRRLGLSSLNKLDEEYYSKVDNLIKEYKSQ